MRREEGGNEKEKHRRHLRVEADKSVSDVVRKRPAIARKGCWARGVVAQEIWQHCACHPPCFLRRISPDMLQRVREDRDETGIVGRLPRAIGVVLLASKEGSLRGSRTPIGGPSSRPRPPT